MTARSGLLAAAVCVLAGCGGGSDGGAAPAPVPAPGPAPPAVMLPPLIGDAATRVSGGSPFAPNCTGGTLGGIEYRNAEVQPHAAANPVNAANIVAVWQQDRWSTGLTSGNEAIVRTMEHRIPGWWQHWNKPRSVR